MSAALRSLLLGDEGTAMWLACHLVCHDKLVARQRLPCLLSVPLSESLQPPACSTCNGTGQLDLVVVGEADLVVVGEEGFPLAVKQGSRRSDNTKELVLDNFPPQAVL